MKKVTGIFVLLVLALFFLKTDPVMAASGKCQVVRVDGTRMIIECNEQTKGFTKGNNIKIKTDRIKAEKKNSKRKK